MRKRFDPSSVTGPRYMKMPPTPQTSEEIARMKELQFRARHAAANSQKELQILRELDATGHRWTRKAVWGYRIFDFWCAELGIAVQIDRPGQDDKQEAYLDEYNYRRSSILVLRVDNRADLDRALATIASSETLNERRKRLGKLVVTSEHVPVPAAGQRTLGF